ncbi:MAG: type I DNA topoisomerase [Tannerellaceae bacterium]|jgi:DNA topoisomerase-1|nr:type I DNA topoisomerase [Tannerellaceae bacterium]
MQKNLVIVESPAKAKTIEKFLGNDFKVVSSYGHIRDLQSKEFGIDVNNNYKPTYVVPVEKKKIVSELKAEAKKAETIWLASDEDREGEAISWHLSEVLKLDPQKTKRIVFHEITRNAILQAIENPRSIDVNLVDAQQARRVLDRVVGFELSPILWRKIKPALSAGRVQSVAVRLIVDREREIGAFVSESFFRVTGDFLLPDGKSILKAELNKRFKTEAEARAFLEACSKDVAFTIEDISTKPLRKSPSPPFTTSTLQQEAARKLGYSVSQTMMMAQRLYEAGFITYMRTDSVNLSNLALATSKSAIIETYGEKYYKFRTYTTKSKGAQEAHEAIRPTYIENEKVSASAQENRLYSLIRKRMLACQMSDAELERTTITIDISGKTEKFVASGEVVIFDGFLQAYYESVDDEAEKEQPELLPPVSIRDSLSMQMITATERFAQRPPRYTEASLVRRLEELGIGRPSTYAPTIHTIQNREYVIKSDLEGSQRKYIAMTLAKGKIAVQEKTEKVGADKNKLMPTDIGAIVNDFLTEYFPGILDYNFTANVEKEFDHIAEGTIVWTEAIDRFYKVFHPVVERAASIKTEHKIGERKLGDDPQTGLPVFVKIGRFGPMAQLGMANSEDKSAPKPQFAALMKGQSIETLSLEEALKLFELPRTIGELEGKTVKAAIGRFGPYIVHNGVYVSIPKHLTPLGITMEEAIELIENKRRQEAERFVKKFDEDPELQILNGRFGPYIVHNSKNYKLPKSIANPAELTYEEAKKIIDTAADRPATKRSKSPKRK